MGRFFQLLLPSLALLVVLMGLLLPPPLALADAPITRGSESQHQGGTGATASGAGSTATNGDAVWRGVQMLPLPSMPARDPASGPSFTPLQQGEGSGALAWLQRNLNPGNWILDAGMGIFAGIVKMFGGIVQKAVQAFMGTASVLPSGCDNAATNFVFCTPANLTYDHPGVQAVWAVFNGIAASIVTILFTVRLGRMIVEGPRSLATEGKGLLLTFIFSMAFIQATHPICKLLIDFFNGISNLLLSKAALSFPSQDVGDLNIGSNILFLVLWIVILLLTLKSFGRLVQIIVLLAVAPLAGALLMDRSTSVRFRTWFEKLIELLLTQINLVIIFIVIAAILQPYQGQSAGDAFVGFLLSIVMISMALKGQSMIGIAGAAMGGGGGGLMSFLRYQLMGNTLRGTLNRRGRGGGKGSSGHQVSDPSNTRENAGREAANDHDQRSARASGDPTRSAAAQRQAAGGGSGAGNRPAGSFRLSDADDGFMSQRANARYQAAAVQRGADGRLTLDARREQALMRARMMRQRASELRANGEQAGADALDGKARLQEHFGRGRAVTRPSRLTNTSRATRREAHRQALGEVSGMHALERDALTQQMTTDEARLPALQRELAMQGATGGATSDLHKDHEALQQRMAANRARLQALTPGEDGQVPVATRQAAAALANERLPQNLRSRQYALRHGAANGSAFVKRIAGAGTQGARDELARARAIGVKAAQTPPDARPPIAPPRRRGDAAKGRRNGAPRRATDRPALTGQPNQPPQGDEPARPSRARSATIAMMRERMQQQGSGSTPPIPRDTPRPTRRGESRDNGAPSEDRPPQFAPRRRQQRRRDDTEG